MNKRVIADQYKTVNRLVDAVKERYNKEFGEDLSPAEVESVYYTLLGIAHRNGIQAAIDEAMTCELKAKRNKRRDRGYA